MKILGGNWKENGSLDLIKKFSKLKFPSNLEIFIALPFPYLYFGVENLKPKIGAQNCSKYREGSHTGEVSCKMIKELGAKYVIIGHSECNSDGNDLKIKNCLESGLKVVYCVGENIEDRRNKKYLEVIGEKLNILKELRCDISLCVAYEPVWAIGTSVIPTCLEIEEVIIFIKDFLSDREVKVLYGGSVNKNNCEMLMKIENLDGFLVGNASLTEEFCEIANLMSGK